MMKVSGSVYDRYLCYKILGITIGMQCISWKIVTNMNILTNLTYFYFISLYVIINSNCVHHPGYVQDFEIFIYSKHLSQN